MSGPYLSANGQRLTTVNLLVPYYGIPVADVALASGVLLTNPVTLAIANATFACALALDASGAPRQRSFAGVTTARIVGGFGGWQRTVSLPPLSMPSGILRSTALRDVVGALGGAASTRERFALASGLDVSIGAFWVPPVSAQAGALLAALAGPLWWVDAAGVTRIATMRTAPSITTPASVEHIDGGAGWATVATEDVRGWTQPGARYTSPTVPAGLTVNVARVHADAAGTLRVEVLTS